jgi:hypothetical protein
MLLSIAAALIPMQPLVISILFFNLWLFFNLSRSLLFLNIINITIHPRRLRAAATIKGKVIVASPYTVTYLASGEILPQEMASERVAPESPPASGVSVVS